MPPEPSPHAATLLELGPGQAEACLNLDQAALGGLWSLSQWQRELEEAGRPGIGLFDGAQLVAMACGWLILDELHITLVAVAPEQRRRGWGRLVLEELLRRSVHRGALRATLEVAQGNQAGQALYRAMGFRTAGVRRCYYRNGEDALIQWVTLKTVEGCG